MKVSRISSKGQVTVPKTIRQKLKLEAGDRVAFVEENGKILIMKAGILALRELQKEIGDEAQEKGIAESDLQQELEQVQKRRRDSWGK